MSRALLQQTPQQTPRPSDFQTPRPSDFQSDDRRGPSSFKTQANALMRKNATLQSRNKGTNLRLLIQPLILCIILKLAQNLFEKIADTGTQKEGCSTEDLIATLVQGNPTSCPIPHPPKWPVLFQIPIAEVRAVRNNSDPTSYIDLPPASCRITGNCPVTMLITGQNRSTAQILALNLFGSKQFGSPNVTYDPYDIASSYILATAAPPPSTNYFEPAFTSIAGNLSLVQPNCTGFRPFPLSISFLNNPDEQGVGCVEGLQLWRDSSSDINNELFNGFRNSNDGHGKKMIHEDGKKKIHEIFTAYDFLNTDKKNLNVSIWYNDNGNSDTTAQMSLTRILRGINAASNSFLQFSKGDHVKMVLEFVSEMPKDVSVVGKTNYATLLLPLFFTWVIQLLLPVMLEYLVYEKQKNLRMIMKMHGLGDCAYWIITYFYFFLISFFYLFSLVLFGTVIGLKSFTLNDYTMQFVFFFIHMNLEIAFAFFLSVFFSDVKTVTVVAYLYVFGTGLLGPFLFQKLINDPTFPGQLIAIIEMIPAFSLYRGLYEFGQYSFDVESIGAPIMTLGDIMKDNKGLISVLRIMVSEWMILIHLAYYLDQVFPSSGVGKHPLWFLPCFNGSQKTNTGSEGHDVLINMEKSDVSQERDLVDRIVMDAQTSHAIVCRGLRKVYPPRDGNPEKHAVRGLSLAIPQGECFGMLGPNGAGKTSFINMMTGFTIPTSGTAFVQGLDISKEMGEVYTSMGVCPQDDLIWEKLSGREHLLFYGRLKNLKGDSLIQAVEESLKKVNLLDKGSKQAGTYSGGMKRRLSVAISLIGNPRVVYLDEPSTGLDPASRKNLWNVVQHAKKGKGILLTTHSMEEAETLCDRVGIFVDGSLQCIGNPKALKARYGGYYMFTMTTPVDQEEEVEKLAHRLSPKATKLYHLSGTQKFQLPKEDVKLADVFREVGKARNWLSIQAWGLSDATLEDVFIKVARSVPSAQELS